MIDRDGWGLTYCKARGEILGPLYDEQLRKHWTRTFPLIKNESWGIEHENKIKSIKRKERLEKNAKIKELEEELRERPTVEELKKAQGERDQARLETATMEKKHEELKKEMEELKRSMDDLREEDLAKEKERMIKKDQEIEDLTKQILKEQNNTHKLKTELQQFQTQLREEMIDKEDRLNRIESLERDLQSQKQAMDARFKSRIEKLKEIHTQENQYLEGMLRTSSTSLREAQETSKVIQARLENQILSLQKRLGANTDDKERHAQRWKQKESQLMAKHELELSDVKARLTQWGHDLAASERRKEADEAQSREARLKNDLRISHENYEKLSERSETRMSQMEEILDDMEMRSKPAQDVISQWKQYRQMMEDHVDNLNMLIGELRDELQDAQRQIRTPDQEAGGKAARDSMIVDLDADPILPKVDIDDDDPVSPEVKNNWFKIKRMMSSINLALGGDSNRGPNESPASTPRRARSHDDARVKQSNQRLELENKKLKWKLEQLQFQLEKHMTDAKHRQHRLQMRQEDDLEEWTRKKHILEQRIVKYKSEVAHLKKIIQERDFRIVDCNQKMEKQQEGLKVLREESEKYAREKKHWQDQYSFKAKRERT